MSNDDVDIPVAPATPASAPYVPPQPTIASDIKPQTEAKITTAEAVPTKPVCAPAGPYGNVGRAPFHMTCPFCHQDMITKTREQISTVTILTVIVLFLVFWPICWLPLCMPECKTIEHHCAKCNRKVGVQEACS